MEETSETKIQRLEGSVCVFSGLKRTQPCGNMTACPLERQRPQGKREQAALFCAEPCWPLNVAPFLPAVRGTEDRASKKAKDGNRRMCRLPWEERRKVSVTQLWGEVGWFLGLSFGARGGNQDWGESERLCC